MNKEISHEEFDQALLYQNEACKFNLTKDKWDSIIEKTLGLVGEAGEVSEVIKKVLRDKDKLFSSKDLLKIEYELGDVLWYIAVLADELDLNLDEIMSKNLNKLKSRRERNVLNGNGDFR